MQSPKAGDIVAFYPNGNEKSRYYIKRIIGEPGDTIQIQDGVVYVNGDALESANQRTIENAGLAEEPLPWGKTNTLCWAIIEITARTAGTQASAT